MTITTLGPVQLLGTSFFSTHHACAADVVAGNERTFTPPAFPLLVGRARRFTSLVTQMQLEVCGALLGGTAEPITVFATRHGEIQTAAALIADFHASSLVSSARFALSVHNTSSGLFSVATASSAPSTTITGANAVAAGWLEAMLAALDSGRTVLLGIADEPVPAVFEAEDEPVGFAAAFLLGRGSARACQVQLAIRPATIEDGLRPLTALARIADAASREVDAKVALGSIQPGATLELQLAPQAGRA